MDFKDAILKVAQKWLDDYAETLDDRLNTLYENLGEPEGFWEIVEGVNMKVTLKEESDG